VFGRVPQGSGRYNIALLWYNAAFAVDPAWLMILQQLATCGSISRQPSDDRSSHTTSEECYRIGIVVCCVSASKVLAFASKFYRAFPTIRCPIPVGEESIGRRDVYQTLDYLAVTFIFYERPTGVSHLVQKYFVQQ
jgi:hypothetical protein